MGDVDSGHICAQVIGSNTDIDPILVHLCDTESKIAICRVRVQASGFSPCQYPGVSNGRVPSSCTHQVNRLAQDHWKYQIWLYSYPTGWFCECSEGYIATRPIKQVNREQLHTNQTTLEVSLSACSVLKHILSTFMTLTTPFLTEYLIKLLVQC